MMFFGVVRSIGIGYFVGVFGVDNSEYDDMKWLDLCIRCEG